MKKSKIHFFATERHRTVSLQVLQSGSGTEVEVGNNARETCESRWSGLYFDITSSDIYTVHTGEENNPEPTAAAVSNPLCLSAKVQNHSQLPAESQATSRRKFGMTDYQILSK